MEYSFNWVYSTFLNGLFCYIAHYEFSKELLTNRSNFFSSLINQVTQFFPRSEIFNLNFILCYQFHYQIKQHFMSYIVVQTKYCCILCSFHIKQEGVGG